jgi:hypothetical protein
MTTLFGWFARMRRSHPKDFRRVRAIPNAELREDDIPGDDASWTQWSGTPSFAASFNGVEYWGSVEKCVEMGAIHPTRDLRELTLTQLRTCLFCLYRVLDDEDGNLGPDDLRRAKAILAEIRDRVRHRMLD